MIPPMKRDWYKVSPCRFEEIVVDYLRNREDGLESFTVEHQGIVYGPDGEFVLDGVARFRFLGADFTVLVECKHHKRPVEREVVQALSDKVRSVCAQKGILFATGGFQSGAIEYARSRSVALVHVTKGGPKWEVRSGDGIEGPTREYEMWQVSWRPEGGCIYSDSYWEGSDASPENV